VHLDFHVEKRLSVSRDPAATSERSIFGTATLHWLPTQLAGDDEAQGRIAILIERLRSIAALQR
jgi:hypothetical protein